MLLGKWKSVPTGVLIYHFIDDRKLELLYSGGSRSGTYAVDVQDDKTILSIRVEDGNGQDFVILKQTAEQILLCNLEDYERLDLANQFKKGKLNWGWDNPFLIFRKETMS